MSTSAGDTQRDSSNGTLCGGRRKTPETGMKGNVFGIGEEGGESCAMEGGEMISSCAKVHENMYLSLVSQC